jgi:hypothetical protein
VSFRKRITTLWRKWSPAARAPADYPSVRFLDSMADVPERIEKTIYVVGSTPKWVIFDCPCNKDHRLKVPLMKSVSPHWRLTCHKGTISLWPSVSVADGPCESHFWLRENRVERARWVHDDEPEQTPKR